MKRALVAALCVIAGCGGASAELRARYAAEVARCVMAERAIVDRASTPEEDARDLATERARCDAALLAAGVE